MKKICLFAVILCCSIQSFATHNRAGEITYRCPDPRNAPFTYEITVSTYTKASSNANRCEVYVFFGDGDSAVFKRSNGVPTSACPTGGGVNLPNDVRLNTYSGLHTYSSMGGYKISMEDPNRNGGIMNIPNSISEPFYIESYLLISELSQANSSPVPLSPPIDDAIIGKVFMHAPVAHDAEGDSLSFILVPPMTSGGQVIAGYTFPSQNGGGSEHMDTHKGIYTWSNPSTAGEFNIAIKIEEWRCGVLIGYVIRDMQVNVVSVSNSVPVLSVGSDHIVSPDTLLSFDVTASDPDNHPVTISVLGDPLIAGAGATFNNSTFEWAIDCSHIRREPWRVAIKVSDNHHIVPGTTYKVVNVKVIGGPVQNVRTTQVWTGIKVDWSPVTCGSISGYKVYRKEASSAGACDPDISNYTLYRTLDPIDTTFTDYPGNAQYCYMVTAIYGKCTSMFEGKAGMTGSSTAVGVDDLLANDIQAKIYPNPAEGTLNIEMISVNYQVRVYNSTGMLIETLRSGGTQIHHDISSWAAGIYYYSVITRDGRETSGKFTVIR